MDAFGNGCFQDPSFWKTTRKMRAQAERLHNLGFGIAVPSVMKGNKLARRVPSGIEGCYEFALIGCTDDSAMITRGEEQLV
jgi:hypothetical protein